MPIYSGRKKLLAALISANAVSGFTLVWPVAAGKVAAAAKPERREDLSAETEFHAHSDIFPCGHFFDGATVADAGKPVCARFEPSKTGGAPVGVCRPAKFPDDIDVADVRSVASLNLQLARRKQSPCPGDQQLVIASHVAQPLEPCNKCHIFPREGECTSVPKKFQLFKSVVHVLDVANVEYTIGAGTALFWWRNCSLDDSDLDIFVNLDDLFVKIETLKRLFSKNGWSHNRTFGQAGEPGYELRFRKEHLKTDVFSYVKGSSGVYYSGLTVKGRTYPCKEKFGDVRNYSWNGVTFRAPYPMDTYLTGKYGSRWRHPQPRGHSDGHFKWDTAPFHTSNSQDACTYNSSVYEDLPHRAGGDVRGERSVKKAVQQAARRGVSPHPSHTSPLTPHLTSPHLTSPHLTSPHLPGDVVQHKSLPVKASPAKESPVKASRRSTATSHTAANLTPSAQALETSSGSSSAFAPGIAIFVLSSAAIGVTLFRMGTCEGLSAATVRKLSATSTLTIFSTMQAILVERCKVNGRVPFHTPSAVLYTEAIKLVIALLVWRWQESREAAGQFRFSWRVLGYALPATIFIVQNNLTFFAMQRLDPPTYQLWLCTRLLPTGIFMRLILGQQRTTTQWVSLFLLLLGMMTTMLPTAGGPVVTTASASDRLEGIQVVLLNSCLAALSGVLNEWLIKFQDPDQPLMLKNAQIYAFGVLVSLPNYRTPAAGGLEGFTTLAWAIVLCNSFLGLSVAAVLKYTDNLVKNYVSSLAVLLSTIFSVLFFGFVLTPPFVLGFLVVSCSSYLYFGTPQLPPPAKGDGKDPANGNDSVVITFGTFDVLHYGHIRILERARAMGKRLVVGLSSDELNWKKKQREAVYPFGQRKAIVEALRCVDEVFAEESLEAMADYVHEHGANLLVMGDDWKGEFDGCGGIEVRYLERTPAISTTKTIETIQMKR